MTAGCVVQVHLNRKIGAGGFWLIYVRVYPYRDRQVAVKCLHCSVKHTCATLESSAPSPAVSSISSTPTSSGCWLPVLIVYPSAARFMQD